VLDVSILPVSKISFFQCILKCYDSVVFLVFHCIIYSVCSVVFVRCIFLSSFYSIYFKRLTGINI